MVVGRPTPERHDGLKMIHNLLKDHAKQLKALKTGRRLESASIGEGGLSVVASDGTEIFFVGTMSDGVRGMLANRDDGTLAFAVYGQGANEYVAMFDRQGNIICSDDTASGQGLAVPYIPLPFYPNSNATPATQSTTADWVTQWSSFFYKQQPKGYFYALCTTPAATSGAWRLWDGYNNVQLGSVLNIAASTSQFFDFGGAVDIAGTFQESALIQVQAKVTSGTGAISTQLVQAYGQQS